MSSFLTAHRANVLAATAPFSGGADPWNYETPSQPIHSLVTWGGPTDTYGTCSFHDSSLYMIDQLNSDGSTTFACEHTGGHTWPSEAVDMARQFFDAHAFGVESPWTDGLPDDMPSFCSTTQ